MPHHPTQADLAARLGLSRATVSRALNGSPLLPAVTRQRVRCLAEELGYQPDPLLSALALRRVRRPSRVNRPAWAFVYTGRAVGNGFEACAAAAAERGYALTAVRLPDGAAALDRQLDALAACGVLVAPLRDGAQVRRFDWSNLRWDRRSWLAIGGARWAAPLHVVRGSPVEGMALALSRMRAYGFLRIAVLREHPSLSQINELQGAGLTLATTRCPDLQVFDCPLLPAQPVPAAIKAWRPQAVLTGFSFLHRRLPPSLASLPWASLGLMVARTAGIAGLVHDVEGRARVAADWLDVMIRRGERGIPAAPCCLELPPQWRDGTSLP
jgi:transcriptional regulator with XRE-family HTH domain